MKSICIKTNNDIVIESLLKKLNENSLDNIYYSYCKFKIYKNIIIHYTGNDLDLFYDYLSKFLTDIVIKIYEKQIIERILNHDYFYFSKNELNLILKKIDKIKNNDLYLKFTLIYESFYKYISTNKSIVLDGFIIFRLKKYIDLLSEAIDKSVNTYLVEREYAEFISLLKMYIESEDSQTEFVHLIYSSSNSTLLDNNKNIIPINKNIFNAKYLSDISFSSNDYTLNQLLSLLPKKIYIHLIDDKIDEFITTLILIFENKIEICKECSICNLYKNKYSKNIKN